jgi:hypothetical protein
VNDWPNVSDQALVQIAEFPYLERCPSCIDQSFSKTSFCPSKLFAPEPARPASVSSGTSKRTADQLPLRDNRYALYATFWKKAPCQADRPDGIACVYRRVAEEDRLLRNILSTHLIAGAISALPTIRERPGHESSGNPRSIQPRQCVLQLACK